MVSLKINVCHSDESQNLIGTICLWETAGMLNLIQYRNDTDSDESQNLIGTMCLWEIAGMLNLIQYRNDNTLFLEAPLILNS
jgi:hypothetical protein